MYDLEYYYKMLRNNSSTAELISGIRWKFINEINPKIVLDYGAGIGWLKAFCPVGVEVDTFDIGPFPQTGICHEQYDIITFWDVLEHIDWKNSPDPTVESLFTRTKYIAISIPILPINQDEEIWKHTKKGEHLFRFNNVREVIQFFEDRNFYVIKIGTPECPPREDISNFIFECI